MALGGGGVVKTVVITMLMVVGTELEGRGSTELDGVGGRVMAPNEDDAAERGEDSVITVADGGNS